MQVRAIDNNSRASFGAVNRWNVKGRDIKQLPEHLEFIKGCFEEVSNHPYYQRKEMVGTIRSTRLNPDLNDGKKYRLQVDFEEVTTTFPQTVKKYVKKLKAAFMPNSQEAAEDVKPYRLISEGTEMKTAIDHLLGGIHSGNIPRK